MIDSKFIKKFATITRPAFVIIIEEGLVTEENFSINLEFIIVGLVDGTMKYMVNTQRKLFIMTIYLEQKVKKSFLN